MTIQSAWRGYLVRSQLKKQPKGPWDPKRNSAATIIQVKTASRVISFTGINFKIGNGRTIKSNPRSHSFFFASCCDQSRNFPLPFRQNRCETKGSRPQVTRPFLLIMKFACFFALNSHRLLLLFSYLMAGRCNDNLGVWFYGTRLKCALIRMVLVIKHDAKGFLPK